MQEYRFPVYWFAIIFTAINLQACSSVQQMIKESPTPAATQIPTSTYT